MPCLTVHPRESQSRARERTYRHAIRGKGGVIPLKCHTIDGNATLERRNSMHASAEERKRWARDAREANRQAILKGRPGGHPEIDRMVLELTRIAVKRIDADPNLVRIGLENIERWTQSKGGYLPRCHAEWKALIERHPWKELREMLLEESDEGQRLRSSHPFKGLVTEAERRQARESART